MAKAGLSEGDMIEEIVELRRTMAGIRASKGLNAKEKRSALKVYGALIETAKMVQKLNRTAESTIDTCGRIVRECEKIRSVDGRGKK